MDAFNTLKCCSPFPDRKCSKVLCPINEQLIAMLPKNVDTSNRNKMRVCSSCYLWIMKSNRIERETTPEPGPSSACTNTLFSSESSGPVSKDSDSSEEEQINRKVALGKLNTVLPELNLSPIYESRSTKKSQLQNKLIKLSSAINADIQPILTKSNENIEKSALYDEITCQLREKFDSLSTFAEKIDCFAKISFA